MYSDYDLLSTKQKSDMKENQNPKYIKKPFNIERELNEHSASSLIGLQRRSVSP